MLIDESLDKKKVEAAKVKDEIPAKKIIKASKVEKETPVEKDQAKETVNNSKDYKQSFTFNDHYHIFHGACPESHKACKSCLSLKVSIG